jgi:hypothetical protein
MRCSACGSKVLAIISVVLFRSQSEKEQQKEEKYRCENHM